jgi:hypothetical protein
MTALTKELAVAKERLESLGIVAAGYAEDADFWQAKAKAMEAILSEKSIQTSDYERGQRDMLNAILALNPKAAQRLHMVGGGTEETFDNHEGRLPFDLVFWVTEVAEQLGIEPKGE